MSDVVSERSATTPSSAPPSGAQLVVFDMDGTLTKHDLYVQFLLSVLRARPLRLARCGFLPVALAMHKLKLRDNTWLKRVFLRAICGGCDRAFIDEIAQRLADRVVPDEMLPGAVTVLRAHQERGDRVALATASLDIYAAAIAERLGIAPADRLATEAQWREDRLTGALASANLYGQNKAIRVAAWARALGRDQIDVAYSDHHSDLPLLRGAARGVAVNPTPRLREASGGEGLEVVNWSGGAEA